MPGNFDLEVDTDWIRRSATTLDGVAKRFRTVPAADRSTAVSGPGLGGSSEATQIAGLVNLRCDQAGDASAQLGAVTEGLADRLRVAAEQFDRFENAIRPEPR